MLGNFTTNLREVIFGTKLALLFPAVPLAVVADFYSFGRNNLLKFQSSQQWSDKLKESDILVTDAFVEHNYIPWQWRSESSENCHMITTVD
ncbi:hypothetical protein JHK87_031654 [Glycine soja]|nr:hypothetical protein JHK87_031654 [Glycine soja]